jgi:hypothetical protein
MEHCFPNNSLSTLLRREKADTWCKPLLCFFGALRRTRCHVTRVPHFSIARVRDDAKAVVYCRLTFGVGA